MGKGGGCVPSKNKRRSGVDPHPQPPPPPSSTDPTKTPTSLSSETTPIPSQNAVVFPPKTLKIFIVFYSMYGHVESLAVRMKKGVDAVDGVQAFLYRVPETLSPEVLELMKAPAKDDSIPEIVSAADLAGADGFLFGFPTRYGCMAAQMKAFFDSTGQLWKDQTLAGKPAGFFVSTGTQGGGQETTAYY